MSTFPFLQTDVNNVIVVNVTDWHTTLRQVDQVH